MSKYVKLNDLTGFDEEFKNALGELEQRIFESYNKFMPAKDGGRPSIVEGEHPMFTEFKENFGYDTGGRKCQMRRATDRARGRTVGRGADR